MKGAFARVLKAGAGLEGRSQLLAILRPPVGQPRRVTEDVPRCHPVSPLSSQRIVLQVLVERTIEVDCSIFGQLEHNAGKDWFAERRCGKERVRSDWCLRGHIGDAEVVLPNRLARTNDSHAETRQRGQIQQVWQAGNERVIGRMDASGNGLCSCEAFEREFDDGGSCGEVQEGASIHLAPWGNRMCMEIRSGGRVGSVALYRGVMRWLEQIVGGLGGQGEVDGCALVLDAGGPDTSAVLIDDAATNGKPQARSAHGTRVRSVALLEAIEDVLEFIRGYAAALVADLDQRFAVVQSTRGEMNLAARRGELDRVREQVVECLQNAVGVGPDVDAVRGKED